MITSSSVKEEGFVGSEFLAVTPHKSFWPLNKSVVRAGPIERDTGPGHYVRKTQGEDMGTWSQFVWSGHLSGTEHNHLNGCF